MNTRRRSRFAGCIQSWVTPRIELIALVVALATTSAWADPPSFITFESGHVRPLALSPNGARLFAVNTPNGTLVVYGATQRGLVKQAEVSVGMEPVAVAVRSVDEVWVVNHLSDSVSVVSLSGTPRVTRTLLVGDEPRDIVFAGDNLAFITTAHRGQHRTDSSIASVPGAGDPQLTTPSVGRADVWVFDPENLGAAVGGTPLKIMTFFSDTPRALAVSPDRHTVYVAAFKSGNQTTSLFEPIICDGFQNEPCAVPGFPVRPGGIPGPNTNFEGVHAPEIGMIVKFNNASGRWEDELGRDWTFATRFRLPDRDVFAIDAHTLKAKGSFAHVGTTLFNMVTNPRSGKLYVSNTEALNDVRFEGPGTLGGSTVRGHFAETRISIISGRTVSARHLNKHIDYDIPADDPRFDPAIKNYSLSTPLEMVVSGDGSKLFVAAFGSGKIGVFDTAALEADTFDPVAASAQHLAVSGGGPSGLALDERRHRLYVLTRFDNSVKVISLVTRSEIAVARMSNPEPAHVVAGRPLLYDARLTSANGEASCAGCHIFGDNDDLAWDLGNPDGAVTTNPMPILLGFLGEGVPINGSGRLADFHPLKGPMTTQTLRGLRHHGAMHWRGDRATGPFGTDPVDAELSFNNFINAFRELLGRAAPISEADMRRFTAFQLDVQLPPNPVRNLDNSLTAAQQLGRDFFMSSRRAVGFPPSEGPGTGFACHECHELDPAQGLFGTNRETAVAGLQVLKIPQLRNAYTKVGKFGLPALPGLFLTPDTGELGDQIRGFAFLHDGFTPTLFDFLSTTGFGPRPEVGFPLEDPDRTRRGVEQFILAFDTDIAPIVGQQITLTHANAAAVKQRIELLQQRAGAAFTSKIFGGTVTECDLVAKVNVFGRPQGFLYDPHSRMFLHSGSSIRIPDMQFRALASHPGQEITFTCVPPGSGRRVAAVR